MADKELWVDGRKLMYGTSIKPSPKIETSSTSTFDEPIVQGLDKIPWDIDASKVRYEDLATHRELSELLDDMLVNPKMVTVREIVHSKEESYVIVDNFFGCLVSDNNYEVKPDDLTVENLKFTASYRERSYEDA